jgi:hypothetical protein
MARRVVDDRRPSVHNHLAQVAADLHILDHRHRVRSRHPTGIPSRVAQGNGVKATGLIDLTDKTKLTARQGLGRGQKRAGHFCVAFARQRFFEYLVDGSQDGILPENLRW